MDEFEQPRSNSPTILQFLNALRERGLSMGVREHLLVARLLSRWDDPGTIRNALAALLARNPDDVRIVRETYDLWFGLPPTPTPVTPLPVKHHLRRLRALLLSGLAILLLLFFAKDLLESIPQAAKNVWQQVQGPGIPPPPSSNQKLSPVPPENQTKTDWVLIAGIALVLATSLSLWLRRVRLSAGAVRFAHKLWADALNLLPGPQSYRLPLRTLAPAFPRSLLDDVAGILGRRPTSVPQARELDVNRSLERTLKAGLAPKLVMRSRRPAASLLVLEDISDDMRPWRHRVDSFLTGLAARGVLLDRWQFIGNADQVFRTLEGPFLSLEELARTTEDKQLLILSSGLGILEGETFRISPWVEQLKDWPHRVWLHPANTSRSWRTALKKVPAPVFAMDREGILAAALRLTMPDPMELSGSPGRGSSDTEQPVTPLDVDCLRWLLALAPRRDPELGELLRQNFYPNVPEAALAEALEAPPLVSPPGVGPSAAEVHSYLLQVLEDSRPPEGSAGYERWRLDRALQAIYIDEAWAREEFTKLAQGSLGLEVERTLVNLLRRDHGLLGWGTRRRLRSQILAPLKRRARREGLTAASKSSSFWIRPSAGETLAGLLCITLVLTFFPWLDLFQKEEILNDGVVVFQLQKEINEAQSSSKIPTDEDVDSRLTEPQPASEALTSEGNDPSLAEVPLTSEALTSGGGELELTESETLGTEFIFTPSEPQDEQFEFLLWLNRERSEVGAPPFRMSPILSQIAQQQAEEIARSEQPGSPEALSERLRQAGYTAHDWRRDSILTELDLGTLLPSLKNRPSSFKDMMDKRFRDLGIGIADLGDSSLYVVLLGWHQGDYFADATAELRGDGRMLAQVNAEREKAGLPPIVSSPLLTQMQMLTRVNTLRQRNGLAPVALNPLLNRVAQEHAEDMLKRSYSGHRNPEGLGPTERARALGYETAIGENIVEQRFSVKEAMEAWLGSPNQRKNFLDPATREIGVGLALGAGYDSAPGGYRVIWVVTFGRGAQ